MRHLRHPGALAAAQQHDPSVLQRMGDAIVHRGPDDAGAFSDGAVLLGMRRLSIIDVAGGHQPITNEDGSVVVVCNGEIYNFRAAACTTCRPPAIGSPRTATRKSSCISTKSTAMRFLQRARRHVRPRASGTAPSAG